MKDTWISRPKPYNDRQCPIGIIPNVRRFVNLKYFHTIPGGKKERRFMAISSETIYTIIRKFQIPLSHQLNIYRPVASVHRFVQLPQSYLLELHTSKATAV